MKKRILAAALALMMLVTAMPVFAAYTVSISRVSGSNAESFVYGTATKNITYKVNNGTGRNEFTDVVATMDGNDLTVQANGDDFMVTITEAELNALEAGDHKVEFTFSGAENDVNDAEKVIKVSKGEKSDLTVTGSTSFSYEKAGKDIVITLVPGTGYYKATGIDTITVDPSVNYTESGDGMKVTIYKEDLNTLAPGKYEIEIETDGAKEAETLKTSFVVKGTGTKSKLENGTKTSLTMERGAAEEDLELTLKAGTDTYEATGISEAFIGETELTVSGDTVIITKEELNALEAGTHTVKAATTGATAQHDAEFTIKVTEPEKSSVSPTTVSVDKGAEKDLKFTVTPGKAVNKAVDYSGAWLDDTAVTLDVGTPTSKGKFTLTLAKEDLEDLDPGEHTLTIDLENEDGTFAGELEIKITVVTSAPLGVYSDTVMMETKKAKSVTFKLENSYGKKTVATLYDDADCETESEYATAKVSGSTLTVTFEEAPTEDYFFYVTVTEPDLAESAPVAITVLAFDTDRDATLKSITYTVVGVDSEDLPEIDFDPQITEYDVELPYRTELDAKVYVTATPSDSDAEVYPYKSSSKTNVGYDAIELTDGEGSAQFEVLSKDGTVEMIYTVNFKVKEIERVDWDEVIDDLNDAKTTGTVEVDMYLDTEIPEEVLLELKGTRKTLKLMIDDKSYWTINGQDITAAEKKISDTDIGFVTDDEQISAAAILTRFGKVNTVELEFNQSAAFGFSAELNYYFGNLSKGKYANLYTYSSRTGFTFIAADEISSTGMGQFTFTSGGTYLVVIDNRDHGKKTMPFTDVPTYAWYYEDVLTAYSQGLIDGMTETTFDPNGNLTIGQAIKLAACMHQLYYKGEVTLEPNTTPWYKAYVDYALSNGIIASQYPNYNKPATRAEMAVIFANVLPSGQYASINQVSNNAIPDVKTTDAYGAAVYKLYRAGILAGNNEVTREFTPNANIKRSEVAAILTRLMNPETRQEFTLR